MPRTPIVGGNWKCNPAEISKLPDLVANINACDTSKCEVYVCPSPLHVGLVYDKFTNGAKCCPQNAGYKGCGACAQRQPHPATHTHVAAPSPPSLPLVHILRPDSPAHSNHSDSRASVFHVSPMPRQTRVRWLSTK